MPAYRSNVEQKQHGDDLSFPFPIQ